MPDAPAPLFGLGHLLALRRNQLVFYGRMQARHGDAVRLRLGPWHSWLIFHPEAIGEVLTHQASAFIRFERVMRILAQWNGNSLIIAEGEAWRGRRRKVLPAFASRRMRGYGARIVTRSLALRDAWLATGDAPPVIDTDRAMVALTLDFAAQTLFGEALGAHAEAVGEAVAGLSEAAFRETTALLPLPDWLPLRVVRRKRWAVATMKALVGGIVEARMAGPADDRGDLLSILIAEAGGTFADVRDEVMTLLIAGHETSGALLSWISDLLAHHPTELAAVQAELDAVLGGRPPTTEDLEALPRLRAVIAEALRLYPPAYALFPRRAVDDVAVGDVRIRAGDIVQIIPYVTQRDARWFPEPERFRPDRFLGPPSWPRHAYLPFGRGPRVCIGQSFGLMEAALVMAVLLQALSPEAVGDRPAPMQARFSLRPDGGLPQRWRRRSGRV